MFAFIYYFFPLFSLVDSETDAASEYDYVTDAQPLSAELPGKENPLDHSYTAHSFSPMLALDFATIIDCSYSDAYPVFVTAVDTIPAILNA